MSGPATDDPVIILTGHRFGIARALARSGSLVVIAHLEVRAADGVIAAIEQSGGTALAIRADLADELDVERLFDETAAAFGGIDVVVHTGAGEPLVDRQAATRLRPGGAIFTLTADERAESALLGCLHVWRATREATRERPGANGRPHRAP